MLVFETFTVVDLGFFKKPAKPGIKMICPFCSHTETKVIESRETGSKMENTRRRRECLKCSKRFTTYERVENVPLTVIKKDGTREQFDREKVRKGIIHSCEKRPITQEQIEKVIDEIELELRQMDAVEIIDYID